MYWFQKIDGTVNPVAVYIVASEQSLEMWSLDVRLKVFV